MVNYRLNEQQAAQIDEAMRDLLRLCQIYRVPMYSTVAVKNDDAGTEYKTFTYGAGANGVYLRDDHIRSHILISNGFQAVPARDNYEVSLSDVLGMAGDMLE